MIPRVLIVDDLTYRAELSKVLESEGYEIILARSGEEAIECKDGVARRAGRRSRTQPHRHSDWGN
jgi:CheY-like chemotaxis protein